MAKIDFLETSLARLVAITNKSHDEPICHEANAIWQKDLSYRNPLWKHLSAESFYTDTAEGSAHVMAMVDSRLPTIGLVGFFGCTSVQAGAEVLEQASQWLKKEPGLKHIYGPINGTITRDYRLNLDDDIKIPGEPVNPVWYIDAFRQAGFSVYNRYVSGKTHHYGLFTKLLSARKLPDEYRHIVLRPFDEQQQTKDLKIYHELMNLIFPHNSIYCPVLTWEERLYNVVGKSPVFDPDYSYFLEDNGRAIGFIVAYPYEQSLVVKTIGLLPEYRGKNLSALLLKTVHDQAAKDGLKTAIYSTIRVGNAAYRMKPSGVKVWRKYVTMHRQL